MSTRIGSSSITIRDVARAAGVSRGAVSKVLCNAYGVSPEMKAKVQAVIDELGYRPRISARGMRGSTYTLGVEIPNISNPFFPKIINGATAALSGSRYQLIIVPAGPDRDEGAEAIEVLVTTQRAALPGVVAATRRIGTQTLRLAPRDKNTVVSPSSLVLALGMLTEGARGSTLAALEETLGAVGEDRRAALAALRGALLANDGDPAAATADDLRDRPITHLASRIVTDDGFTVDPAYIRALADVFDAGVQQADLGSNAGMDVLSAWIRHHTGGLIEKTAIEPSQDLRLVLQDAVLLAARWETPFAHHATALRPFTLPDGNTADAETMAAMTPFAYAEVGGWRAVRLPYVEALHADVLLPPQGTDPAEATPELLAKVSDALDAAKPELIELTLPTLDIRPDKLDLLEVLPAIGAPVRCLDKPDLSGMGSEELCVLQAVQQAVLKVDEEGTVAAAVTEIGLAGSSTPMPVHTLHFNRPFLLTISHTETAWPLFLAAIRDPRH